MPGSGILRTQHLLFEIEKELLSFWRLNMMSLLLTLVSLNWTYLEERTIQGWFAERNGRPFYSVYYDKPTRSFVIVQWSNHPREVVPLALVLDKDGFRVQPRQIRDARPWTETMQ
jgi:hypothetical protein